jgi:hypothetical protein
MSKSRICEVSEVFKTHQSDGSYLYGFTVAFSNGMIRNITRKSRFEDDELIAELNIQKEEYEKKREEK